MYNSEVGKTFVSQPLQGMQRNMILDQLAGIPHKACAKKRNRVTGKGLASETALREGELRKYPLRWRSSKNKVPIRDGLHL